MSLKPKRSRITIAALIIAAASMLAGGAAVAASAGHGVRADSSPSTMFRG